MLDALSLHGLERPDLPRRLGSSAKTPRSRDEYFLTVPSPMRRRREQYVSYSPTIESWHVQDPSLNSSDARFLITDIGRQNPDL